MSTTNVNSDDDAAFSQAMQLASSSVLPMTLEAAVELDLFEIMAAAKPKLLSSAEIASQITTKNSEAPMMVERILRFLASSSVLKYEVTKTPDGERLLFGLNPVCKYFVRDKDGVSLGDNLLMLQQKVVFESGQHMKDAVVDGGVPFEIAHGMSGYEYTAKNLRFSAIFNRAMYSFTTVTMRKLLEVYKGFEGLKQVVDVGGGTGANLAAIVSRFPNIRGINYDMSHVVNQAPPCKGVEQVAGDMFESVPSGDAIFLKNILHNWSDDQCVKLLKNCWKALPKSGKVIVVEALLPQYPHSDNVSNIAFRFDIVMLRFLKGGKERTDEEFDVLAKKAGFTRTKVICGMHVNNVIEFYKM